MFLVLCWAPGTKLPFCLPPRGCSYRGLPSLPPPPGMTDGATARQPSCIRASHRQAVAASDSPLWAWAGIKLQRA